MFTNTTNKSKTNKRSIQLRIKKKQKLTNGVYLALIGNQSELPAVKVGLPKREMNPAVEISWVCSFSTNVLRATQSSNREKGSLS